MSDRLNLPGVRYPGLPDCATEGSLCTGYNGLGVAVEEVLGTELAWYSEVDPAPAEVMAARYPGVPNLGDLTALAWEDVPTVDVMTAGYPCQPFQQRRPTVGGSR